MAFTHDRPECADCCTRLQDTSQQIFHVQQIFCIFTVFSYQRTPYSLAVNDLVLDFGWLREGFLLSSKYMYYM